MGWIDRRWIGRPAHEKGGISVSGAVRAAAFPNLIELSIFL